MLTASCGFSSATTAAESTLTWCARGATDTGAFRECASEPTESGRNSKCGAVRRGEPKLNCPSQATLLSAPTQQVGDRDGSLDYDCEKPGATSGRAKAKRKRENCNQPRSHSRIVLSATILGANPANVAPASCPRQMGAMPPPQPPRRRRHKYWGYARFLNTCIPWRRY